MYSLKLAPYRINVFEYRKRRARPQNISNFGGHDLRDIVVEWAENLKTQPIKDPNTSRHLQVIDWNYVDTENREIEGHLGYGLFGDRSDIVTAGTDKVVHPKEIDEVERIPLYFRFFLPAHRDEGIFILQKTGKVSLYDYVWRNLQSFAIKRTEKYRVRFEQFVNMSIINDLLTTLDIGEVLVSQPGVSSDIATHIQMSRDARRKGKMEFRLNFGGYGTPQVRKELKKLLNEPTATKGFLSLPVEDLASVRVQLLTEAGPRILDFANPFKFNFELDVTKNAWTEHAKITGIPDGNIISRTATQLIQDRILRGSM